MLEEAEMSRRPTVAAVPEAQYRLRAVLAAGVCEQCCTEKPFRTWEIARKKPDVAKIKTLDKNTQCAICLDQLFLKAGAGDESKNVEVLIETCNHAFHVTCLAETIKAGGRSCPICRVNIAEATLKRLDPENKFIREGEEQRLGYRSTNPDEASWYSREEQRAVANNGDDMLDAEPEDPYEDPYEDEEGDDFSSPSPSSSSSDENS